LGQGEYMVCVGACSGRVLLQVAPGNCRLESMMPPHASIAGGSEGQSAAHAEPVPPLYPSAAPAAVAPAAAAAAVPVSAAAASERGALLGDGLPEEEVVEVSGADVVAMGAGAMIAIEDDY
jgi:hypothetical protein